MKFIKYFLIIIIILDVMFLGFFGTFIYSISRPHSVQGTVVIEKGKGLADIAQKLEDEGVVGSAFSFTFYALLEGKANKLQAGTYEFNSTISIKEIVRRMEEGTIREFVRVTVPEGFTKEQIAERLEAEGVIKNRKEFLSIVDLSAQKTAEIYGFVFLRKISANSLEGFLFPDTYEFNFNTDDSEVVEKFLTNFEQKTQNLFVDYDTLILASLLEKEVQTEEDMKLVAGVVSNRLEIGMALQIDATLVYITGKKTGELLNSDKLIDSPYNTYQNRGLPPAPIANPGLRAITAALNPVPNNYLYYLSDLEGNTHFAETLEQHNENKARYLR